MKILQLNMFYVKMETLQLNMVNVEMKTLQLSMLTHRKTIYSILPITRTSKGPMKMVRVNECSSYPRQIMKKY